MSTFQDRATKWVYDCFGIGIAVDTDERNYRFLEEALELVQACSISVTDAHALVDYVFSRPAGEIHQELGGTMITLATLASAHGEDILTAGEDDLNNAIAKTDKIRVKWGTKPEHVRGNGLEVGRDS